MPPKKDKKPTRKIMGVLSVKLFRSPLKTKKYRAVFYEDGVEFDYTDFGAIRVSGEPYEDYTMHKDDERKANYLARHEPTENWNDPYSPGALSKWVLWNKPTLEESWNDYKRRFNFQ
jgi:hypothetical protein